MYSSGCPSAEYFAASADLRRWVSQTPRSCETFDVLISSSDENRWLNVEPPFVIELVPRGRGPHFRRSRHYDIRAAGRDLSAAQHEALTALGQVITDNDR